MPVIVRVDDTTGPIATRPACRSRRSWAYHRSHTPLESSRDRRHRLSTAAPGPPRPRTPATDPRLASPYWRRAAWFRHAHSSTRRYTMHAYHLLISSLPIGLLPFGLPSRPHPVTGRTLLYALAAVVLLCAVTVHALLLRPHYAIAVADGLAYRLDVRSGQVEAVDCREAQEHRQGICTDFAQYSRMIDSSMTALASKYPETFKRPPWWRRWVPSSVILQHR
jgi:hypothetical protein